MLLLSYPSPYQASGFDYNSISGLYAWWKADAITGKAAGDPVASWTDSKGGFVLDQATQSAQPLYQTGVPGGKPYLDLSAGDKWMGVNGLSVSSGFTLFLVFAGTAAPSSGPRICEFNNATAANQGRIRFTASGWGMYSGPNSGAVTGPQTASGGYTAGAWVVAATRWQSAANANLVYNGTTRTNTGDMSPTTPTGFYLGSSISGSNRSNIYVAEILVYNAALSNTDETAVLGALNNKYGVY